MSKLFSKEESRRSQPQPEISTPEADQILHLKRLLVTMKQHYEKTLHSMQVQFQEEQNQRIRNEKDLEVARIQLKEERESHEEELQSLHNQHVTLKELLKKVQNEWKEIHDDQKANQDLAASHKPVEPLFRRTKGINLEVCQLREELEKAEKKLKTVEEELEEWKRQNEMIHLESKEKQQSHELQKLIHKLEKSLKEKEFLQDKYEQLKDEWKQITDQLEENIELRHKAEKKLYEIENENSERELKWGELQELHHSLLLEKKEIETERNQQKALFEESETRLKVAQQHLAKKVKETTLQSEKITKLQTNLAELLQNVDHEKTQIAQLQASVELYQRQEKRLQEQMNDALKGWEEKYFRMYDKWQESENQLKKFEEKHQQMQNFLTNLGHFMGNPPTHPPLFPSKQDGEEKQTQSHIIETHLHEGVFSPSDPYEEKYDLFGMPQTQK